MIDPNQPTPAQTADNSQRIPGSREIWKIFYDIAITRFALIGGISVKPRSERPLATDSHAARNPLLPKNKKYFRISQSKTLLFPRRCAPETSGAQYHQ
jgi:hypothetical protein